MKQLKFLVIEDNDLDVEKIERGFKRLKLNYPMIRAKNGIDGLDILRGTNGKEQITAPYVVLLDLNMPRMNGHEFLEEVRTDKNLKKTPVFILTTSEHPKDINNAFEQNVAGYIVKPIRRDEMTEALSKLDAFWNLSLYPE